MQSLQWPEALCLFTSNFGGAASYFRLLAMASQHWMIYVSY